MKNNFLYEFLAKIGLTQQEQEKVADNYKKLIFLAILNSIKNSISQDKFKEILEKTNTIDELVKALNEESKNLPEKDKLRNELIAQINKCTDDFFHSIIDECPNDKRQELTDYLTRFSS